MQKETNQAFVYILAIGGTFLGFLAISCIATQYLAQHFNYSPNLGQTFLYGYYNPFNWLIWTMNYYSYYPAFFDDFLIYVSGGICLSFMIFIVVKLFFLRQAKAIKDLHGSAHWASLDEIKKMGILDNKEGVYLGGYVHNKTTQYLRHNGPEHTIAFAPTRSGKGVGLVLPTLLSWAESALIFDIKGELWALTAGWRKKYAHNKVLKFDPTCTDGSGVRFNILEEIRLNTIHEIKDTQNIAINLVFKGETPPSNPSHGGNTSYFKSEATSFLTAVILYALHNAKQENKPCPSLSTLYKFVNNPDLTIEELLDEMICCEYAIEEDTLETLRSIAQSMKNKASQELSGVIGSSSEALNLYIDPIIAKNISKSEFRIRDLMNLDNPVSLYIIISPGDKDRLRPLNNILVNQIFKTLTSDSLSFKDGKSVKNYKHRLLFMADEFTSVGKLGVIEEQLAYMAGYGIKAYIIIQDLQQLYGIYTQNESIISNCHNRIAFAPNKFDTAKVLSDMSGTTTVIKRSLTSSGKRTAVLLGNVSETIQEVQRPLITPDEVLRLRPAETDKHDNIIAPGDMLIFIAGQPAIYGRQILHFKDPTFLERAKVSLDSKISDTTF